MVLNLVQLVQSYRPYPTLLAAVIMSIKNISGAASLCVTMRGIEHHRYVSFLCPHPERSAGGI